jgi:hypothetical protein
MKIWLVKFGQETPDGTYTDDRRFSGKNIFEALEKAKTYLEREIFSKDALEESLKNMREDFNSYKKTTLKEYEIERRNDNDWEITSIILNDNLDDVE